MTYRDFSSNFKVIFKLWNLPRSLLLCDAVPTTELTNKKIAMNIYHINWAVYTLVTKNQHLPATFLHTGETLSLGEDF